jgi:hypothetical protein
MPRLAVPQWCSQGLLFVSDDQDHRVLGRELIKRGRATRAPKSPVRIGERIIAFSEPVGRSAPKAAGEDHYGHITPVKNADRILLRLPGLAG